MADTATHKMTRPTAGAVAVFLLAFGLLVGLGVWQVQRLHEKEVLLATLEARLNLPPVDFAQLQDPLAGQEWAVVSLSGRFLPDAAVLVGPRTREGVAGLHVFMPLELRGGRVIYVNRGFVPANGGKPAAGITVPAPPVTLIGIVRKPARGPFTPANDPFAGAWYWPDLAAMFDAHRKMLGAAAPVPDVYIQQTIQAGEGYPVAIPATLDIPNDHRGYAAFWFSMAGLAALFFWLVHRRRVEQAPA